MIYYENIYVYYKRNDTIITHVNIVIISFEPS